MFLLNLKKAQNTHFLSDMKRIRFNTLAISVTYIVLTGITSMVNYKFIFKHTGTLL